MLFICTIFLAACIADRHRDYEMGLAVNTVTDRQIYDRAAAADPPVGVVNGMDGTSGEKVIVGFRSGKDQGESSAKPLRFEMKSK